MPIVLHAGGINRSRHPASYERAHQAQHLCILGNYSEKQWFWGHFTMK